MGTVPDVSSLTERKLKLLAACDLQREMIALELGALKYRLFTFKGAFYYLPKLLWVAAPLAGLLAARKARRRGGFLTKGVLLVTAVRKGWKIWRALRR